MYDLQTIHRLNDLAALRKQFPEHDCSEEVTYNPEYDEWLSQFEDEARREAEEYADRLAIEVQRFVDHLRAEGEEFEARDVEFILASR